MKKAFLSIFAAYLFNGCIVPHLNKNVYEFDNSLLGNKKQIVSKSFRGSALIFSLLPTGDEPDMKTSILELMKENNCVNLKNIEIEFYQKSFIVVGFPQTIVTAQCIK